jgi:protein-S-isoprenylcysteine O-methyltransferase Ste14
VGYRVLVFLEIALAVPTFVVLRFVPAPYGRHTHPRWGPAIPARLGWVVMESPAPLVFVATYWAGAHRLRVVPLVLLGGWLTHYLYRTYVYPFLVRPGRRLPVVVVLLGIAFNTLNAYVNARGVSSVGDHPAGWLADPRFLVGAALFAGGLALNAYTDRVLRRLRRPGETGYRIPRGWAFDRVSSPNYLGEIVEWTGWALATWSLAGLAFAIFTFANLAPRALTHHRWYRQQFPDYPPQRRALVPYLL